MADTNRDWRELCIAVSSEGDPTKLGSLVEELIEALDDGKQGRRHTSTPSNRIATSLESC
jgi:hypothetical protein